MWTLVWAPPSRCLSTEQPLAWLAKPYPMPSLVKVVRRAVHRAQRDDDELAE